jgi:O-acetyl-ADP-ribose deacetylase (regulator of RNase III)
LFLKEAMMAKVLLEKKAGSGTIRVVQGDITERDVDAIVNAANIFLQHGGGVAGAIVRKGGDIIQEESNAVAPVDVGKAAITGAGRLKARYVIHAVGPRMGEGDEDAKLKSAVISVLELATEKGMKSISLPAISSGIFGFPKDRCARMLVGESAKFLNESKGSLEVVEFCLFDDSTAGLFREEAESLP